MCEQSICRFYTEQTRKQPRTRGRTDNNKSLFIIIIIMINGNYSVVVEKNVDALRYT